MEKFCKYCGNQLEEESKFCTKCGKSIEDNQNVENNVSENDTVNNVTNSTTTVNDTQNVNTDMKGKTNPLAIAGFVCSLVGLLIFGLYLGIIAITCSVLAKKHIKLFENETGEGLATAGLVIGIIDVVGAVISWFILLAL